MSASTYDDDLAPVIARTLHTFRCLAGFRGRPSERALIEALILSGIARAAGRELAPDEILRGRRIREQVYADDFRIGILMPGESEREAEIDRALRRSEGLNGFEVASGREYETFRLKTV